MAESPKNPDKGPKDATGSPKIPASVRASRSVEQMEVRKLVPQRPFISQVIFALAVVVVAWIAYMALPALVLFFAAVVLAVVFHGCARLLDRVLPGGPKIALAVVVLLFVGLFSTGIVLLAPQVTEQLRDVLAAIPDAYARFAESELGQALLDTDTGANEGESEPALPFDMSIIERAAGWATNALRAITSLTLVFVVAIFVAVNPASLRSGILSLFPLPLRPRVGEVVDHAGAALWRWTIGQAFSMVVIGILTVTVYASIGLDFALTLGLIAGLFQFIPYFGPALSAIPALAVGFSMSYQMALWVAIAYTGIQTIEGNFITPLIMRSQAYLPPVLSIMSTVVFGLLFGIAGAALATPLVIVFLTLYQDVYQRDILGAEPDNAE